MAYFILYILCIFMFEFNEANPQYDGRILFHGGNNGYLSQQSGNRQGTIDEFLAIRSTTEAYNQLQEPCYPQQYARRNKRSPHFKRKRVVSIYPVHINYQNVNNVAQKPPYSHYGGYYCGNSQPYVKPPVHNNLLSHITNLFFGGIFDENSQQGGSSVDNSDIRPVYENNEFDISQNAVIAKLRFDLISI